VSYSGIRKKKENICEEGIKENENETMKEGQKEPVVF
jgi:hypothetical protein